MPPPIKPIPQNAILAEDLPCARLASLQKDVFAAAFSHALMILEKQLYHCFFEIWPRSPCHYPSELPLAVSTSHFTQLDSLSQPAPQHRPRDLPGVRSNCTFNPREGDLGEGRKNEHLKRRRQ
ncbi:unnamed protein product [Malus baccata var. baccata]